MELPKFRYHPDPIATGVFEKSNDICECCSKAKGYIYTSSFYTAQDVKSICPWCISDGSAATKYNGSFSDDYPLIEEGVDPEAWPKIIQHYEKGGQPSVYKFKCTECQEIVLTMDYT